MSQTDHVHWGVILQLGLVVVLLVVLVTLQLSHLHVVNQQRIVLEAAETNVVASGLYIRLFILDLGVKEHTAFLIIISGVSNSISSWVTSALWLPLKGRL